ncbi:hypothetical protein [Nocardioides sp.]|uniref:hypothetical protein n=1 Tax=Nocardioides sp. TaxID=35761 RepID=UPI00261F852C|nr:hypothetical protein [Nocardioides sp.]
MITQPFLDAIAEAEKLIESAPNIATEQDLLEGYDYLAGRIRAALQLSFDYDLDRPVLINSTHQFSRQGLDNPDAIYFHAWITDGATYRVRGRRGSSADLSFQVMGGGYEASGAPPSLAAFDDREIEVAPDGTFDLTLGPYDAGAKTLIIREVFSDWDTEERGTLWIERVDRIGRAAEPLRRSRLERKYEVAARILTGSIQTWFAFPHFFQYQEPVNTLTVPASTPGGLASQFSSIGHYRLADDEALLIEVPRCADAAYQAIQIGSDWYASTDYETHQTSLTADQAVTDPDGVLRFVVSERPPLSGAPIANWLEATGHQSGPIMLRWQRLTRELTAADGPRVSVVPVADLAGRLPAAVPLTAAQYAERITARQRAVARRMLS